MFNAWIETRPAGIGASEDAAILRQVRAWFSAHGEARFTSWDRLDKESDTDEDRRPQTMHRAGWRRRVETTSGMVETECIEWLCLPAIFREDACRGFRWEAVLRLLDTRGHLVRERQGEMGSRVRVPKFGKAQVYIIRSTLLDETDA
jgi:putative DNA primase/helicase